MTSPLVELNQLTRNEAGVYSHPQSAERDFAYSDGSAAERHLHQVFTQAEDLSSASEELQQQIHDWPSEYHLSPKRANLLRALPFQAGERVLELGCGCGAITRFLGEAGCDVDAVEGSAVRAELARMRCRDLADTRIVQANFNKLALPAGHYDSVLLIGVAEYARRFSPDSDSDRGAVLSLLGRIHAALKPGGRVIIAIENRTGMKYLHGAHEDHYSLRYVGIDDYVDSAGIRTYTRREWMAIADESGFAERAVLLPFPDYKIPTVLLGEDYCARDPHAWCHLEGIDSADYTFLFDPFIPETLTWQGYNAAGVLADMANSFLLVLSPRGDLSDSREIDFVHLPDFRRRREFCTVVSRRRDESLVYRAPFNHRGEDDDAITSEPYFAGMLLSSRWVRAIMIQPDPDRFHELVAEYLRFLEARQQAGPLPPDLLPNNIVVDEQGNYQVFDQEWRAGDQVDVDYLLFRALLTFANHYRGALRQFARRFVLYDVRAFITHVFAKLKRGDRLPTDFCEREDAFQERVLVGREGKTEALLSTPICDAPVNALLYPSLCWSADDTFGEGHRLETSLVPGIESVTLCFELPASTHSIASLRFSPCGFHRPHDSGFFHLDAIRIVAAADGARQVAWSLDGEGLVLGKATLAEVSAVQVGNERLLAINGEEPSLTFTPQLVLDPADERRVTVEVVVRYSASREYLLARQDFLCREGGWQQQVETLERRLAHARQRAERAEAALAGVQSSRAWRLLSAVKKKLS